MSAFVDRFGSGAAAYAAHRPTYPAALFAWLGGLVGPEARAWDCATGTGQAAVALAEHVAEVIATDASEGQIAQAALHPRVRYAVAPAAHSGLETGSVDLVTVAQALHWFDAEAFGAEVRRVLRPGGLLAVWTYDLVRLGPEVDRLVSGFYRDTVGQDWPPERRHVEEGYANITLPGAPVAAPAFEMTARWTLDDLVGYVGTWSALRAYRERTGTDPLPVLAAHLTAAWGEAETCVARWPLTVIVRRMAHNS